MSSAGTSEQLSVLDNSGERMVPELSSAVTFWEHVYRYRFARRFVRGKRVLDIACGEGYGTAALSKAGAASVIGMDISREACEHAAKRYGILAVMGDAEDVPLRTGSVDMIVSFETLEHLRSPHRFIAECRRLLAADGTLVVSTPDRIGYNDKEVFGEGRQPNRFHLNELDKGEFMALLGQHFRAVDLYSQWPIRTARRCIYSLASYDTFWLNTRGFYRLRKVLRQSTCAHVWVPLAEAQRTSAVELILQDDSPLSYLVNPYMVRRWYFRDRAEPRYLVAVARR